MEHESHRPDGVRTFYACDANAWRTWLSTNYEEVKSVWLIIYRKDSGIPSIRYPEAVDEALCFGWIDSKPNKRDEHSFYQYFSKRKAKSNWSRVNKDKIARLLEADKMTSAGLEMVKIAKANGTWTALNEVENLVVPADLQVAFDRYPGAETNWHAFPRSVKRSILEWILNAKRSETRTKRIETTANMAQRNERANQYRKQ
ncbi:MAG: YdeI/OmpD-associated family protein [Bacteroidota bacterium]